MVLFLKIQVAIQQLPNTLPIAGIPLSKDDFTLKPTPKPVVTETIDMDEWDDDTMQQFESVPAFKLQ